MTDLIKRDDALAACDIAPPDEWNDYTKGGYDFAAEECKRNIAALPALTPTPVADSKTANPVVNDPAAIREAALREAYGVVYKWWFGDGNELPQELILALIGEKK